MRRAQATKDSTPLDYGGYGVRFGLRGWAFNERPEELESAIARAVRDRDVTQS